MYFKLLIRFACVIFVIVKLSSCTSKDSKTDTSEIEILEDTEQGISAEDEFFSGTTEEGDLNDALGDDFLTEEVGQELPLDSEPVDDSFVAEDSYDSLPEPSTQELAQDQSSQNAEVGLDLGGDTEEYVPLETAESASEADVTPVPERKWVSVKKIHTQPYEKNGKLINAVYIVRPADTLESISRRIYGEDKSAELLEINPYLNTGVHVGRKVYYSSPNRPDDSSQLLFYPVDAGIPSQTHTLNAGDNIRVVSAELLGFDSAWKEVWATNPDIESKDQVDSTMTITYFPSFEVASNTTIAKNEDTAPVTTRRSREQNKAVDLPPTPTPVEDVMPNQEPGMVAEGEAIDDSFGDEPPMQDSDEFAAVPPPPPVDAPAALPPPPPPPPRAQLPPPPSRNEARNNANDSEKNASDDLLAMLGDDPVIPLAGGALALFAAVALIVTRRKKKSSEVTFDAVQFESERSHKEVENG